MKRTPSLTFVLITLVLLLASCSRSGPGPSSWIDKPLDKSSYPLQPLEIIAHASSDAGVSSIEFIVDDTLIGIVRVRGNRFEIARQAWHPEEPGVYQVKITSLDSAGQRGPEAVSIVYIGNNEIDWLAQGGAGYGDCDPVEVLNFVADPPAILPGECANIFWEVLSPGEHGVIVDGEGVPSFGEMRVCPEETRPFELIVESAAGLCRQWLTVYVNEVLNEPLFHIFEARPPVIDRGECSILFWEIFPQAGKLPKLDGMEVPFQGEIEVCPQLTTPYVLASDFMPELFAIVEVIGEGDDSSDPPATFDPNITPTITLTPDPASTTTPTQEPGSVIPTNTPVSGPTNTPTADTTPPAISNASVSPSDFIYTTNGSCSPTAFNISVKVTDAGGVSSVSLNWTGSGVRSGPESMYYSAGKYVKNLGLFINPGSLSNFSITATDTAGNTSTLSLGWNLDVELCGGS